MNLTINLEERLLDTSRELIGFSKFEDIKSIKLECESATNKSWSVRLLLFVGEKYIKQLITIDRLEYETACSIIQNLSMLIYGYKLTFVDSSSQAEKWSTKPLTVLEEEGASIFPITIRNDITSVSIGHKGRYCTWTKSAFLTEFSLIGPTGNYSKLHASYWECVFGESYNTMKNFCDCVYVVTLPIEDRLERIINPGDEHEIFSLVFKYDKDDEEVFLKSLEGFISTENNTRDTVVFKNYRTYKDSDDGKMVIILGYIRLVKENKTCFK